VKQEIDAYTATRVLASAARQYLVDLDAAMTKAIGIDMTEFLVLASLADTPEGRANIGELGTEMALPRSTMTYLSAALDRKGLAVKKAQAGDRRKYELVLTASGARVVSNGKALLVVVGKQVAVATIAGEQATRSLRWFHKTSQRGDQE
jgi:DNA-binding MarR family transcriptional regulator